MAVSEESGSSLPWFADEAGLKERMLPLALVIFGDAAIKPGRTTRPTKNDPLNYNYRISAKRRRGCRP
jgi:hypothetical protein